MLRGNVLLKVDEKGRLRLPSVYRSVIETRFGREFFVTSLRGDSVKLYPLKVYAALEERLGRSSQVEPLVGKLRNAISYYGQSATMDAQGRILIHPLLREKAGINGEVAVLGQQDFLEVWDRKTFENRLEENPLTDGELSELAALGF
jgi:MraZ protein